MSTITLITDYGTRDPYVGAIKGVILSQTSKGSLVDITHDVEPYNIRHGAFVLHQIWPFFPKGTIHLVIVDPGVGTTRRILVGQYDGQTVIAPDNGLITLVHREFSVESMHIVENRSLFRSEVSSTFHGRDIMAPVAARLADGMPASRVGRVTDRVELFPVSVRAEVVDGVLRGGVLYVDQFGSLVTNIRQSQLSRRTAETVYINGTSIGTVRTTFADVPIGEPVALVGGSGCLEVAVNQGRAVGRLGPIESLLVEVRQILETK